MFFDADHTEKVEKLVEAIDETHTKMFKESIAKVDASHTKKLQNVVEKFRKELNENATEFKDGLVQKVSKFLDLKIEEMVPQDQLHEAVENIQSRKLVNEIKKLLSYDPESINDDVKVALKEGYDAIENLKKELNEKSKENLSLLEETNKIKGQIILESKIKDLPEPKRKFIQKFMTGKTPDYIEGNIDYVLEMYEQNEKESKQVLVENAKKKTVSKGVEVPPSQIKDEVINESSTGDDVADYLKEMHEMDNAFK